MKEKTRITSAIRSFFESIENLVFPSFKIAIISYYYSIERKFTNGVAVRVYYDARELARHGCEVHIFTKKFGDEDHNISYIGRGKIIVHYIQTEAIDYYMSSNVISTRIDYLIFERNVILTIANESKLRKFDVINTQGWLTSSAFALKLFLDIKWVHTLHFISKEWSKERTFDTSNILKFEGWIEQTIKFADRFIAVSENSMEQLCNNYNVKRKNVVIIKNGVDTNVFYPRKIKKNENKTVVGFVGRLSEEKGFDILIECISFILKRYKNIYFTLVIPNKNNVEKDQAVLKYYSNQLDDLKKRFNKNITIIDKSLDHYKMSQFYNSIDIYIQTSHYENLPFTIIEAMACGKTVIATNVGGIKEIVRHNKEGYLIEARDAKMLIKHIVKLSKSREVLKFLSNNAYNTAIKYSWENIGIDLFNFYKKLILFPSL